MQTVTVLYNSLRMNNDVLCYFTDSATNRGSCCLKPDTATLNLIIREGMDTTELQRTNRMTAVQSTNCFYLN